MKSKYITTGVWGAAFILFTILIKIIDVAPVGPMGTSVGFSTINTAIFNAFGSHLVWNKVCHVIMFAAIAIGIFMLIIGLLQWIKRKSFFDVNKSLRYLLLLYVLMVAVYVIFEIITINYRPILMEGDSFPKGSYPSSHCVVVFVILGSVLVYMDRFIKPGTFKNILTVIFSLMMALTAFGRIFAGVHWVTDVIGAALISVTLLHWYSQATKKPKRPGQRRNRSR